MSVAPVELQLRGVERRYKGGFTLSVPQLKVEAGSTLALLGPSGSGKSTLLEIAALLEPPDDGEVLVDGVARTPRDPASRYLTAAVFQRPYLMKATVGQNVAYGLKVRKTDRHETAIRVAELLDVVGLAGMEDRSSGTLSGGEAQRVALARALVLRPRLLTLDEPLSSLDLVLRRRMQREFSAIIRAQGITTIYVTHDHDEALVMSDRIAILRDGRIVAEGGAEEVVGVPLDAWTAMFLGVEPPIVGTIDSSEAGMLGIRAGDAVIHASGDIARGTRVRVGIRPEDVTVWKDMPGSATSARNHIRVTISEMRRVGVNWTVVGTCDGFSLAASVSGLSLEELALKEGEKVIFAFKATAVRAVPEAPVAELTVG